MAFGIVQDLGTPPVVPALRQWIAQDETLMLGTDTRIQVTADTAGEVARYRPELQRLTGAELITRSGSADPSPGDISVRIEPQLPAEGYLVRISDGVDLAGADRAGVAYGLQTLIQLLRRSTELPKGHTLDYPAQRVRGVMLDLGRRYWSIDYLREWLSDLEWRRFNRLHLHLTDWNAVRVKVDSPDYRHVAAPEAYDLAELHDLVILGRTHHIEVVPEIDLPSHATAFVQANPAPAFPADEHAMNSSEFGESPPDAGWTIDITRASNRKWLNGFVKAIADGLDCPSVHIGGDEWQDGEVLDASPTLSGYARQLDPGYYAVDALLEYLDEVRELLAADSRATEIWSWWESTSPRATSPSHDMIVVAWSGTEDEIDWFLHSGYRVISTPFDSHYVTPLGLPGNVGDDARGRVADPRWLYETWEPRRHPLLLGYQYCVWADRAEGVDDHYFEWYSVRARQVLADRMWGGPRRTSVDEFFDVVDELGPSPLGTGAGSTRTVRIGATAEFESPVALTAVRFRPVPPEGGWVSPYDTGGTWTGASLDRLEQLRGLSVQLRAADDAEWRDVIELPLLPIGSWNLAPLPEPSKVVAARLVARHGDAVPASLADVEWLAER
jgi:hexosaminidase